MKVRLIQTDKIAEYENNYAVRLIEQGKAVPVPETAQQKAAKTRAVEKAADK